VALAEAARANAPSSPTLVSVCYQPARPADGGTVVGTGHVRIGSRPRSVQSDHGAGAAGLQCLSVCKRPANRRGDQRGRLHVSCSATCRPRAAPQRWCRSSKSYQNSDYGLVPWRERADVLRKCMVARVAAAALVRRTTEARRNEAPCHHAGCWAVRAPANLAFAEQLVGDSGLARIYLATSKPQAMTRCSPRIAHHRARRGEGWLTVEEPLALVDALTREATHGRAVLVDCLTMWLSNLMLAEPRSRSGSAPADPVSSRRGQVSHRICVERGSASVSCRKPRSAATSRDAQGRLNQIVAATVPNVVFIAAGFRSG